MLNRTVWGVPAANLKNEIKLKLVSGVGYVKSNSVYWARRPLVRKRSQVQAKRAVPQDGHASEEIR